MELLTRNNFEGWMQKLMERLDRQDELLLAMKAEGKQPTITESIRLFDNQDLCMLLQISKTHPPTLPQRRRIALQDAGQEDLLQRGGRADIPFQPYQGLQKGRYSLLQGSYP